MKLRTRLIVTLAATALVVALPAVHAVSRLSRLEQIASQQRTQHAYAFVQMGALQTSLAELDRFTRGYLIASYTDPAQRTNMEAALRQSRAKLDTLKALGYGNVTRELDQTLAQLERAVPEVVELIESGRPDEASAHFERMKPLLARMQNLEPVAREIDTNSQQDILAAKSISASAQNTTLLALAACLLVALAFGTWNAHRINAPILQLRHAMADVAEGDFVLPPSLPFERDDEIGDLSRSFAWMTQELRKLDQMKAEFISIATHELKTPINVISGYAELIDEGIYGAPSARQREALDTIREQTRVLTNLVNQLLDVSRLEAGGLQLEMQDVIVRDLLNRVERSFSVLARKKNIDFKLEIDSSVPRSIRADSDRIGDQVVGNLLSNALKFTPDGGSIRVRAWAAQEGLTIEVNDSGIGVPPDQLPYIFDKYFQIGQQARSKGAGLGLAIARDIVEAHGGHITVESEPGQGTTFRILLPTQARVRAFTEKTA